MSRSSLNWKWFTQRYKFLLENYDQLSWWHIYYQQCIFCCALTACVSIIAVFTILLQWFLTQTWSGNLCSTLCHVTVRVCSDVCVRCDKFHHRYLPKRPRKTMRKRSSPRSGGNIRVFLSLSRWYLHGYKPSCLFASVNFAGSWLTFLQSISACTERQNRKEFMYSTWRPIHKL